MAKLQKNKGFTLLETIIAMLILAFAIMGPLDLATRSIMAVSVSQNQITAFYLAQEAVEFVRNTRDTNFIEGEPDWLDGLNQCFGANNCYLDIPNQTINPCGAECPVIKYDRTTGYYNYLSGDDTIFTRSARIQKLGEEGKENEANIRVTVSWEGKFGAREIVIEENIFNWK